MIGNGKSGHLLIPPPIRRPTLPKDIPSKNSTNSPRVVAFAEYHAAFEVEASAHVRERLAAAGALQAAVVPVPVKRVQEEPLDDFAAAAGAFFERWIVVIVGVVVPVGGREGLRAGGVGRAQLPVPVVVRVHA